jgi:repressor LexA
VKLTVPTERQNEVLAAIESFIRENGYSPTIRELSNRLGVKSVNGIQGQLNALRVKGRVTWTNGKSRTLRLTPTTP